MASSEQHKSVVIHFDIDCFYAQVEMIRKPELRVKPLGIQQKYLLVTCNYEARKRGVTKLMSIVEAKKRCPEIVIVKGEDLSNYRNMSYQISYFIQKYTPMVERLGFDENFADVTDLVENRMRHGNFEPKFCGNLYEEESCNDITEDCPICSCGCLCRIQVGSQIAEDIRKGLKHELGITCCAGIAHNKILSKLVGSIHKPNQQTSILPHLGCQLVSSLSGIRAIPGIGHTCEKRLKARGILSVWELQQTKKSVLEEEFGKAMAQTFSKLCFGIDDSAVVPFSLPQTLSDEDSFKCCNSLEDAKSRIHQLGTSLLKRLKEDNRTPHTLRLTVRRDNVKCSRQCPIPSSTLTGFRESDDIEMTLSHLMPILMNLFYKLVDASQKFHLTLINVCFAKFVEPNSKQNTIDTFFSGRSHAAEKINVKYVDSDQIHKNALSPTFWNISSKSKGSSVEIHEDGNVSNAGFGIENKPDVETMHNVHEQKQNSEDIKDTKLKVCSPLPSFSTNERSNRLAEDLESSSQSVNICHSMLIHDPEKKCDTKSGTLCFPSPSKENYSLKNLQRLLPKYIDAQEVFQLPEDIQSEVLSSFGISLTIVDGTERIYENTNTVITRSRLLSSKLLGNHSESSHQSPVKRKRLFSPKEKKLENEYLKSYVSNTSNTSGVNRQNNATNIRNDFKLNQVTLVKEEIKNPPTDTSGIDTVDSGDKCLSTKERLIEDSLRINDNEDYGCGIISSTEAIQEEMDPETRDVKGDSFKVCNTTTNENSASVKKHFPKFTDDANTSEITVCPGVDKNVGSSELKSAEMDRCHNVKKERTSLPSSSGMCSGIIGSSKSHFSSKKRKCPEGIDADVFYSLPLSIQGEIMAHNAMGTGELFLGNQKKFSMCNSGRSNDSGHKNVQKNLFNYFKRS